MGDACLGTVQKHEALCVLFTSRKGARENLRRETQMIKDKQRTMPRVCQMQEHVTETHWKEVSTNLPLGLETSLHRQ